MKKALLCPPQFYQIEYEINPWMDRSDPVNKEIAWDQYRGLKKLYEELGLEVQEIAPVDGLPDMVYAANFGLVEGNMFIVANFKYPERKPESEHAATFFREGGYEVVRLPDDVNWEGQGDLLQNDDYYFLGYGKRSDKQAIEHLRPYLSKEIIHIEVNDPYFYHLDTCFSALNNSAAIVNPRAFSQKDLQTLRNMFPTVIETSEEDNKLLCCNNVAIGDNLVVGAGISQKLKDELAQSGFVVHEVPMSEFLKGGGSVQCLTLVL